MLFCWTMVHVITRVKRTEGTNIGRMKRLWLNVYLSRRKNDTFPSIEELSNMLGSHWVQMRRNGNFVYYMSRESASNRNMHCGTAL